MTLLERILSVPCPLGHEEAGEPCYGAQEVEGNAVTVCASRINAAEGAAAWGDIEPAAMPGERKDVLRPRIQVGRTLYDCRGRLVAVVDTPDMATLVVEAVNAFWGSGVEPKVFPRVSLRKRR